jgi:hypothetical protein
VPKRRLGKLIIEAQARANASEMMVVIFVMMVLGMLLAFAVCWLQSYLLRWQAKFETHVVKGRLRDAAAAFNRCRLDFPLRSYISEKLHPWRGYNTSDHP